MSIQYLSLGANCIRFASEAIQSILSAERYWFSGGLVVLGDYLGTRKESHASDIEHLGLPAKGYPIMLMGCGAKGKKKDDKHSPAGYIKLSVIQVSM